MQVFCPRRAARVRSADRHRPRAARRAAALLLALAALLAACSPTYDWREARPADSGWTVLLPGRPSIATRDILLGDLPVSMTMQGARVGDVSFTVAAAMLPDAQPATHARAIAAMRQALVRNIGGRETSAAPASVPRVDAAGRPAGTATGVAIEAAGQVRGVPVTLLARLVAHDRRAVQALVVGPGPDREQAATFFDSLRLRD